MAKTSKAVEDLSALASENINRSRQAVASYFNLLQNMIPDTSMVGSEFGKKAADYMHENIQNALECTQQMMSAKNPGEALRIQGEFFQNQMRSLANQAGELMSEITKVSKKQSN